MFVALFFFQAEDGIRPPLVTGVQTCALPISAGRAYGVICADRGGGRFELSDGERHLLWTLGKTAALVATARNRSEERRVGKECRSRWQSVHCKEQVHAGTGKGHEHGMCTTEN